MPPDGVRVVVGLGNPGPEYRSTRHNAGFLVLERLAERMRGRWRRGLLARAATARLFVDGRSVLLIKPLTYMNLSGQAVAPLVRREKAVPQQVLLVYDDMDLPLGRLRIRPGGRAGGHRGVASVLAALGTEEIPRVRVGIGRPPEGVDAAQYVLSPVPAEERQAFLTAIEQAAEAVGVVLTSGLEAAMARYNAASGAS